MKTEIKYVLVMAVLTYFQLNAKATFQFLFCFNLIFIFQFYLINGNNFKFQLTQLIVT